MADSKRIMERLARLERDVSEIKGTLMDHGTRLDRVEAAIHVVHRGLNDRMDSLERGLGGRFDALERRLDRLIAVTIEERTHGFERLADIERRLTKVEDR